MNRFYIYVGIHKCVYIRNSAAFGHTIREVGNKYICCVFAFSLENANFCCFLSLLYIDESIEENLLTKTVCTQRIVDNGAIGHNIRNFNHLLTNAQLENVENRLRFGVMSKVAAQSAWQIFISASSGNEPSKCLPFLANQSSSRIHLFSAVPSSAGDCRRQNRRKITGVAFGTQFHFTQLVSRCEAFTTRDLFVFPIAGSEPCPSFCNASR
jgi:hypothetical protein